MAEPTLLAGGLLALAAACVYAYVGARLGQRPVSADARLAAQAFSVWWMGLAAITAVGGLQSLAGYVDTTDLAVFTTLSYVNLLVISAALWGLLYYLVYLFTGSRRALGPITAFYAATYVGLVYMVTYNDPIGVTVGRWGTTIQYANPLSSTLTGIVVFLILLPPMIGAIAYGTLYFRVKERTTRYRIALVSASIIVWFGSVALGSLLGLSSLDWWQLFTRFLGLAAAFGILLAYRPPPWLQRKLGVKAVYGPAQATSTSPGPPSAAPATEASPEAESRQV